MKSNLAIVTGVPGWLGTRLAEFLIKGMPHVSSLAATKYKVRILKQKGVQESTRFTQLQDKLEVVEADLTEPDSLRKLFNEAAGASVFHVAGVIHPLRGVKEFYSVNYEGTRTLTDMAIKGGARRVIYMSSDSVLGHSNSPTELFDEQSSINPNLNYGRSKLLAEQYLQEISHSGAIEAVIVRAPWFYGIGQPVRQSLFFSMVRSGLVPIVGTGNNLRSMACIDNLCQGLMLCEQVEEAKGQIYWLADKEPYSMNKIVGTIEKVLEQDFNISCAHKRVHLPNITGEFALVVDKAMQGLGLYSQKIHVFAQMNKNIACKIDKAKRELGYDPKVSLEEGMRASIAWALSEGHRI